MSDSPDRPEAGHDRPEAEPDHPGLIRSTPWGHGGLSDVAAWDNHDQEPTRQPSATPPEYSTESGDGWNEAPVPSQYASAYRPQAPAEQRPGDGQQPAEQQPAEQQPAEQQHEQQPAEQQHEQQYDPYAGQLSNQYADPGAQQQPHQQPHQAYPDQHGAQQAGQQDAYPQQPYPDQYGGQQVGQQAEQQAGQQPPYPQQPYPQQPYPQQPYPQQQGAPDPREWTPQRGYDPQAQPGGGLQPDAQQQAAVYPAEGYPATGPQSAPQPQQTGPYQESAPQRAQEPQPRRAYSAGELIDQLNPQSAVLARRGLRGRLRLKPSSKELAEVRDDEMARTPFSRPVTIMIANPKGGVGKTPTALLLAAAFGTSRGGGVIAWDNNELRGTMPDRSFSPHRRTVRDMLDSIDRLAAPQSQFTDLAQFLNHQTTGKSHTLGSAQTYGHVVSRDNFEQIHDILARYFQIIIVDTGNNEASPNWLAAAAAADCLAVPTKWRKDSLIPAARMLETLQEANRGLLDRTVIVATNGPADSQEEVKRNSAQWFTGHQIVEIPTDPHLAEGGVIDWAKLQPRTRRAGLSLAATVAERIATVAT